MIAERREVHVDVIDGVEHGRTGNGTMEGHRLSPDAVCPLDELVTERGEHNNPKQNLREAIGVLQASFRLPVLVLRGAALVVRPDVSSNDRDPSPTSLIYTGQSLSICTGTTAHASSSRLSASTSPVTHPHHTLYVFNLALGVSTRSTHLTSRIARKVVFYHLPNTTDVVA